MRCANAQKMHAAFTLMEDSHPTTNQGTQTNQVNWTTHATQTRKITHVDVAQQDDIAIAEPNQHPCHFGISMDDRSK